jgi:hypothetical protein
MIQPGTLLQSIETRKFNNGQRHHSESLELFDKKHSTKKEKLV